MGPDMPIFEYRCACGHEFEALVRPGKQPPPCPACGGTGLERLFSLPAVKSDSTRAKAMKAAKARDKKQATERVNEQRNYEKNHD
jgi:putative FmdB family regulatory protein